MLADPAVRAHMTGIDCHSYWSDAASKAAFRRFADANFPEKCIRMSEWCEMVHGTDPGMDSAIVLAKCVWEDLTLLNVVHWCSWVAVSPGGYHDGLIHASRQEDGTVQMLPLKRLWAYGNFSRFIRPGFTRVEVIGAEQMHPVAFHGLVDGQERLVLVMINDQPDPCTVPLEGDFEAFTAMQVHETSDAHDLALVYDGPVQMEATVPGRAVVTVVLTK